MQQDHKKKKRDIVEKKAKAKKGGGKDELFDSHQLICFTRKSHCFHKYFFPCRLV